ncbi:MAG: oxidoreductase [Acidobacteriota bacterium]|nr:oxidoreductase [Acidobacteriota bacterium]
MSTFKGVYATQQDGKVQVSIQELDRDTLPAGDVLVRVRYSDLNYKDGLAVTGRPGVIRKFPMIPGIDLAGVVEESTAAEWKPGDEVVITGFGLSETVWGGYAELARVDAKWLVRLPQGLTLKQAMAIGTAGFTAMQCVLELERHGVVPGEREVLVTGAAGGVGSVAVAVLAKLGYKVVASTGRAELGDYLRSLGASEILDRNTLAAPAKRPLDSERWAGAVDSVGGDTLAAILRGVMANGSVAACGVAGGSALNTTVFPFILRGVRLLGVNSVYVSQSDRQLIWQRLTRDLPLPLLDSMTEEAPLEAVFELGEKILSGRVRGRVVFKIS